MCDFITAAGIGLSIAQGVMGYQADQAQYKQQTEVARQNAVNASRAAENQYSALNIRAMQEDAAANQQQLETNIDAAKATATIETAAVEGNVAGLAVDNMLGDIYAQKGRHDAALDANFRMNRDYLAGEKKAAQAGGQSQINSVPLPEKPSFVPHLINTFASGLNTYTNFQQRKVMNV